jgi:hypothetical protein
MKEEIESFRQGMAESSDRDVAPIPSMGPGFRQSMPERRESFVIFTVYGGFGRLHAIALVRIAKRHHRASRD